MAEDIKKGEIIIYKSDIGPELEVQMDGKTVWLSISQMAELFEKDVRTIATHIRHVYGEKELELSKTSRIFAPETCLVFLLFEWITGKPDALKSFTFCSLHGLP